MTNGYVDERHELALHAVERCLQEFAPRDDDDIERRRHAGGAKDFTHPAFRQIAFDRSAELLARGDAQPRASRRRGQDEDRHQAPMPFDAAVEHPGEFAATTDACGSGERCGHGRGPVN